MHICVWCQINILILDSWFLILPTVFQYTGFPVYSTSCFVLQYAGNVLFDSRCQKRKKEQTEILRKDVEFLQQLVDQMKTGIAALSPMAPVPPRRAISPMESSAVPSASSRLPKMQILPPQMQSAIQELSSTGNNTNKYQHFKWYSRNNDPSLNVIFRSICLPIIICSVLGDSQVFEIVLALGMSYDIVWLLWHSDIWDHRESVLIEI